MKPYGYKIGADSNWGVGKQPSASKGRERMECKDAIKSDLNEITDCVDLHPPAQMSLTHYVHRAEGHGGTAMLGELQTFERRKLYG